mmetsp:Transcript_91475/g.136959  ORF Transcript_91475/g.136959 Transcript_91475/m.136959 type:complete len:85 (+) Transcript_91475:73-327(+)
MLTSKHGFTVTMGFAGSARGVELLFNSRYDDLGVAPADMLTGNPVEDEDLALVKLPCVRRGLSLLFRSSLPIRSSDAGLLCAPA